MITIDPEFQSVCPLLSTDERVALEESLKKDGGATNPLIVWGEEKILLDGHNRYEICTRLGLDFDVKQAPAYVATRSDAVQWICKNQLSRRNLGVVQRTLLAERLLAEEQAQARERQRAGKGEDGSGGRGHEKNLRENFSEGLDDDDHRAIARVAAVAGMSRPTFEKTLDIVERGSDELKNAVDTKEVSVRAGHTLLSRSAEEQKKILELPAKQRRIAISAIRDQEEGGGKEEKEEKRVKQKSANGKTHPKIGMFMARNAIQHLENIQEDDEERQEAFAHVKRWIDEHEVQA